MSGAFRYAKSIAASLAIAVLALGARYAQSWVFRDVEDLIPATSASIISLDELSAGHRSQSSMRSVDDVSAAKWQIGVVTNRTLTDSVSRTLTHVGTVSEGRTLSQQVADVIYETADSTMGFTEVRVPLNRRRGELSLDKEDDHHVVVSPWAGLSGEEFFLQLVQALEGSKSRDVFVFVHGFNVSLDASIARAAQMAEDMPFDGVMIAFSWQSAASAGAYLTDERLAERHFWGLAKLLADLRQRCGEETRLHVLAHSMGNRVALRALNALAGRIGPNGADVDPFLAARIARRQSLVSEAPLEDSLNASMLRSGVLNGVEELPLRFPDWGLWQRDLITKPPIASLVLAAPDVDAVQFTEFVNGIGHLCRSMVLYASDTDVALEASRKLHGNYRAGDSRAGLNINGLRIVRVTGVGALDPLGHSYYGSHPKVLKQIGGLVKPPIVAVRVSDWR